MEKPDLVNRLLLDFLKNDPRPRCAETRICRRQL
jgi:hypothetical protein